jgi:hypothetical protein
MPAEHIKILFFWILDEMMLAGENEKIMLMLGISNLMG